MVNLGRVDEVFEILLHLEKKKREGVSAKDIASMLETDRSNISRYLNILHKEGKLEKIDGRPVLYKSINNDTNRVSRGGNSIVDSNNSLDKMVGATQSLAMPIQKAKAAIMYPPKGLHTLLLGETGVGKSMFAELMYQFAIESNIVRKNAPFIRFNCADYVDNPNLLTAQIFGVKKGAYTGADRDRNGLLTKADSGFIFLDEIHRLPPQGQEMLFTYIDNGFFRPLGETEKLIHVDVRIIAATTENPNSHLLKTFTRRIPMIITLPPIRDRSLPERYFLIETFIKEESHRLGKSIYINKNSIISYLLYDCPNNIGQLKSDIQLACAKAFLRYKSENGDYLIINQGDLPNHVRKGILNINEYRSEVDELLNTTYDIFKFNQHEEPPLLLNIDDNRSEDFYTAIEEKLESLKGSGIDEKDINEIINIDIESHFEKYIGSIHRRFDRTGISNVVNDDILQVAEEILLLAQKHLGKEFDEKIYFGLSFHLERSIERIKKGEKIYNPKLNSIRINYEEEFLFAMKIAKILDSKFHIETPVDEIGYLAMFFTTDSDKKFREEKPKVGVIVVMHGRSTASSMVEVANSLIGIEHAVALDMPLSMNPKIMYELTKDKVQQIDKGKGVVMLVDMGSLTTFGDMIWEETGIEVRTLEKVSTPMVLEVLRKVVMGYGLDEIIESLNKKDLYKDELPKKKIRKNIIVTACFTGDGASKKLKSVVETSLVDENIEIMAINIIDEEKLENRICRLSKEYNIIAIIATVNMDIGYIPFIPAIEVFRGYGINKLKKIIDEENMYMKVAESLKEHLTNLDGEEITRDIKYLIYSIENKLEIEIISDAKIGIVLHISFLIDNLLAGVIPRKFEDLKIYRNLYEKEMNIIKESISFMEKKYKVSLGEDELAYILKLFLLNQNTV
ncbi:sigma 54-interacting transcriptional regulator [Clostridium sp. Cult1]|uniref:sigma 54-interacting transcriptional regulator n=1 Tax=Clostridium sp. Cult1 TaxID=2079002 RepID=UPI003013267C